jgi:hypothetical protein
VEYQSEREKAKTASHDEQRGEDRERACLRYVVDTVLPGISPDHQIQKPQEKQGEHAADEGTNPSRNRLLSSASVLQQILGGKPHALQLQPKLTQRLAVVDQLWRMVR